MMASAMKYFLLHPLGDQTKEDYVFTDNGPKGVIDSYDLIVGVRVADEYPDGIGETTLKLGDDYPGLDLPSFIGNTHRLLIVDKASAALIKSHDVGEIEEIPFALLNHKGRVHSRDYVFLNPIGTLDCLDLKKSEIEYHDDGEIRSVTKLVLDPAKLVGVRELFRPAQDPDRYIFSEKLVTALQEHQRTNFVFRELELSQRSGAPGS
jgi:hypothetical protein